MARTAETPANQQTPDQVADVRQAAKKAELHGVAVNSPVFDRFESVTDWPKLIVAIRAKKGPVARVWDFLSKETQQRVGDEKLVEKLRTETPDSPGGPLVAVLKASVAADLRKMIDNPDFFEEKAFQGIGLTKTMKDAIALGKKRTLSQTAQLNWALLDATFPDCLPEIPKWFRTVRIQVLAGSPVVLVLSSFNPCRWEVKVREGAKVAGVVLCGNGAQELVGVDAPLVYRSYYAPDGVNLARPHDYFSAPTRDRKGRFSKEDEERYKSFLAKVKEITGKEFTSFQSEERPGPESEPYIIRPVAD